MPSMSVRWRNAAIVMAVLGFVAFVAQTPPQIEMGAINAVLWFGIVYIAFLAVHVVRRVARR